MTISGEVENGADLVDKLRTGSFDMLVLDMNMPGRNGVDLLRQVKLEAPKLPVLVLSSHKEDLYAVRTIKAGASGYLCKDYASSDLPDAIRKIAGGGKFITPKVAELLAMDLGNPVSDMLPHTLLSNREYQIFLLIVQGAGMTEIAEQLSLSVKTVSTHKVRIKEKMQLSGTSDFVKYAIQNGLIDDK